MKKYFSMFRFYYYVYKGSAKKYDIAMDTDTGEGFIASFTPMVFFLSHIFLSFFMPPIFTLSIFIWIPIILGNLTIVHNVGREGREIQWAQEQQRMEAEREAKQREYDRIKREQRARQEEQDRKREERVKREWERVYRDFFERMNEEGNREKSHQQTRQKSYTSRLDSALTFLGLSRGATKDDVKRAYRKLAKKHHPDMGGNEKDFIKLKEHYDYAMSQLQE